MTADVTVEADLARLGRRRRASAFGGIDILVNNAALFSTLELRPFEAIPPDEWRRVMEVNTLGSSSPAAPASPR